MEIGPFFRNSPSMKTLIICVTLVAFATFCTAIIAPLRENTSLMVFVLVVVVAARFGGLGLSLLTAFLSCFCWIYFISDPTFRFEITFDDAVRLTAFSAVSILVGTLFDSREKERLRAEASERQLNAALRSAGLAVWGYDQETNQMWASQAFRTMCGSDENDTELTLAKLQSLVHPEDRSMFVEKVSACISKGEPFDVSFRLTNMNKTLHTIGICEEQSPASGKKRIIGVTDYDNVRLTTSLTR